MTRRRKIPKSLAGAPRCASTKRVVHARGALTVENCTKYAGHGGKHSFNELKARVSVKRPAPKALVSEPPPATPDYLNRTTVPTPTFAPEREDRALICTCHNERFGSFELLDRHLCETSTQPPRALWRRLWDRMFG